jgi:hypothetical protein
MQINIALNSDSEGIYDRTLIFEDYTDPNNPVTILRVGFHGEVEGEDSRLAVMLGNFGREFRKNKRVFTRFEEEYTIIKYVTIIIRLILL